MYTGKRKGEWERKGKEREKLVECEEWEDGNGEICIVGL